MLRQFLYAVGLATLLLGAPVEGATVDRPNILFIMVDDLGKDWISCYGADGIQTPHVDALAKGGLLFHNAWSMPQCTPTRVTLLTGQYPWRTGWVNHWDVPRWGVGYFDWQRYTTFASLLKSAGYRTAIAGKWQINDFRVESQVLALHGFDDWCVWTGFEGQNPPSAERYWDPYLHTKTGSRTYAGKFGPDLYCDFLIDFMREHHRQPMMLYFPMALTHGPLVHTPLEAEVTEPQDKLKAMVRYVDHLTGRLVHSLDELGIRDRTIIIFTTDNGTAGRLRGTVRGQRPSGGKASKFEGGVCAPFIVNCPGLVPEGEESNALTDFSDLLPTFAELAGAKIPSDLPLDGVSLAPVMLGRTERSAREWIMALGHGAATLDSEGVRGVHAFADRVIRDRRFKVWVEPNREISQLYDLRDDPLEQDNLLGSSEPQHTAARAKFQAVLDSLPPRDARPQYRRRPVLPWDKQPADGSRAKKRRRKSKSS